jgi:hypothetical protein
MRLESVALLTIARPPVATAAEEVGLSLAEAMALLFGLQAQIVAAQLTEHATQARACPGCRTAPRTKDYRAPAADPFWHPRDRGAPLQGLHSYHPRRPSAPGQAAHRAPSHAARPVKRPRGRRRNWGERERVGRPLQITRARVYMSRCAT